MLSRFRRIRSIFLLRSRASLFPPWVYLLVALPRQLLPPQVWPFTGGIDTSLPFPSAHLGCISRRPLLRAADRKGLRSG